MSKKVTDTTTKKKEAPAPIAPVASEQTTTETQGMIPTESPVHATLTEPPVDAEPPPINSAPPVMQEEGDEIETVAETRQRIEREQSLTRDYSVLRRDWAEKRIIAINEWFLERAQRKHRSTSDVALADAYRAEKTLREFELSQM